MSRLYIHLLPRAKYARHGYVSVADFFQKHPPFDRAGEKVVMIPNPIENAEDLEAVIAKMREVANG